MRWLGLGLIILFHLPINAQYLLTSYPTDVAAYDLITDHDGNYYLCGSDWLASNETGVVSKYDSTGTLLWKSKWGDEESQVSDIVLTEDNRLFGINAGKRKHEFVFELDVETGDTLWATKVASSAEEWGCCTYPDIWMDNGHVVAFMRYDKWPERKRLYSFNMDTGEQNHMETQLSDYGFPRTVNFGRNELYPQPIAATAVDSQVVFSYTGMHDTIAMHKKLWPIDTFQDGGYLAFFRNRKNSRIQRYSKTHELIYDEPIYEGIENLDGAVIHSSAKVGENLLVTGYMSTNGSNYSIVFHRLFNYEYGLLLWDTIINPHELRMNIDKISYANGHLYAYGSYNGDLRVYKLNLDYVNIIASSAEQPKAEKRFKFSPNPTSSTLNIKVEQAQETTIGIYSLTGALLLERQMNTHNAQLDVSALPEGMYVARVKTAQGVESQKVVISR